MENGFDGQSFVEILRQAVKKQPKQWAEGNFQASERVKSNWLEGKSNPGPASKDAVCEFMGRALGVDPDLLLKKFFSRVGKSIHPEFADRLQQAADRNPHVPPLNRGRLIWFAEQIKNTRGENVTNESVRKWFSGETLPRSDQMAQLAEILAVDHAWLSVGQQPEGTVKAARARNAEADGAVNLVAGAISMDGGRPAFPTPDDKRAAKAKIDIYAVIRGVNYGLHVALEIERPDGLYFAVPADALGEAVVIGVSRQYGFDFRFYELDREGLEAHGKFVRGMIEVKSDAKEWRRITSFEDRL